MPVIINVSPVIIPALCSSLCQLSFISPLYANLIQSTMSLTEITKYNNAMVIMAYHPVLPANKKYVSISMHGEKNIAITSVAIILFFDSAGLGWLCR